MRIATVFCVLALLATTTLASVLTEPTIVSPDSNGVTSATLTVAAARITVDSTFTFTTRLYYLNGQPQYPGPTFHVKPGGILNITLINNLAGPTDTMTAVNNSFHNYNATNIHTHGLHVDPAIDSIFRTADPAGGTLSYVIPIPSTHAAGMHWYHAHHHGGSTLQVMGGLLGGIVMEPSSSDTISSAITSLPTRTLVFHYLNFLTESTAACPGIGVTNLNPFRAFSFDELNAWVGTEALPTLLSGTSKEYYTVNGLIKPTLSINANERWRFRSVFAAGIRSLVVFVGTTDGGTATASSCSIHLLANDGIYFDSPKSSSSIIFVPATRAEFTVICTAAGTYYLNSNSNPTGPITLMSFVVSASSSSATDLPSKIGASTPTYLNDLQTTTATAFNQISFVQNGVGAVGCAFQLGMGSDCSGVLATKPDPATGPTAENPTCPHVPFSGQRGLSVANHRFSMALGAVAEFSVYGVGRAGSVDAQHPIHIHVNHFQIISYTSLNGDSLDNFGLAVGMWRDTVPVLPGKLTVRFLADLHAGEVVVHCHVLSHEDRGLMDTFLITPSATATTASPAATTTSTTAPGTVTLPPTPPTPMPTVASVTMIPPTPSTTSGASVHSVRLLVASIIGSLMLGLF